MNGSIDQSTKMTNETTKLLGQPPSACSTDGPVQVKVNYTLPLTSSFDDVQESLTVHLQALDDEPKPVFVGCSSKKLSAKRLLERHQVFLMLLFVLMIVCLEDILHLNEIEKMTSVSLLISLFYKIFKYSYLINIMKHIYSKYSSLIYKLYKYKNEFIN